MLHADFIYVAVGSSGNETSVESLRTRETAPAALLQALREWAPQRTRQRLLPINGVTHFMAFAPVGLCPKAVLVAGAAGSGFPTETQRLLLNTGANETALAMQRWHAETEKGRFASLVDRSGDFIGVADLEGRPQYVNPAGLAALGLKDLDQAGGATIIEFLAKEDRDRARDECWPAAVTQGRWTGELGFRHFRTGETIPFLVDWFLINDPRTHRPMNIATVSRDLSAQKRSEAQLVYLNKTFEQAEAGRRVAALSPRELQVLKGLVQGKANKVIAADLGISVRTIEVHRAHMLDRLRARKLADAVRLAVMSGISGLD